MTTNTFKELDFALQKKTINAYGLYCNAVGNNNALANEWPDMEEEELLTFEEWIKNITLEYIKSFNVNVC